MTENLSKDALAEIAEERGAASNDDASVANVSMSDAEKDTATTTWGAAFRKSIQAARYVSERGGQAVPPSSGNTSMLLYAKGDALLVNYVHWVQHELKRGALVGRAVAVDDGKLVYSVPSMFPAISFKSKADRNGKISPRC